jgi:hypothetical protein
MYFFLMFGLPVAFLLLVLREYPVNENPTTRKAFLRGLAAFIPTWLAARLLGPIVPAVYGSFLLAFHEWADRLLPYAVIPALAYLVFYKPGERLPPGAAPRRFTAFYAGALTPVGICEAARVWGSPEPYALFVLPILLGAICVIMPKAAALAHMSYGIELAAIICAVVFGGLAASLCPFLFHVRLWPLALLIAAAACAFAWRFAFPELGMKPPAVSE